MNGDIRPPRIPESPADRGSTELPRVQQTPASQAPAQPYQADRLYDHARQPQTTDHEHLPRPVLEQQRPRRRWPYIVGMVVLVLLAAFAGGAYYMNQQLRAVEPGSTRQILVTVPEGASAILLGQTLEGKGLVRNDDVFSWYVRLTGAASQLQAGAYRLSPGQDVSSIIGTLTGGKTETFRLTFIPGRTLQDYKEMLIDAGYNESDIDDAFTANYDSIALQGKPGGADLEGYIYPDTYEFAADATASEVVKRTIDQLSSVIIEQNLASKFDSVGLSVREGIILASIIEKEAANNEEMAQISQVFHLRLKEGMPLGSDPTYQYIADKMGVARSLEIDSPYNTRRFGGLTPGPIASPSLPALLAAASPADGDFVYFVHGDDDQIHFARTNAEHEENVARYCKIKCQIL